MPKRRKMGDTITRRSTYDTIGLAELVTHPSENTRHILNIISAVAFFPHQITKRQAPDCSPECFGVRLIGSSTSQINPDVCVRDSREQSTTIAELFNFTTFSGIGRRSITKLFQQN
jgi:hypothetical protein